MADNKPFSLLDRLKSFTHAFRGLALAVREEHNMRIHLVAAVVAVGLGWWLKLDATEWMILVICITSVIAAELFNTAIERLADHVTKEQHPAIKACKDLASAAVLVVAIGALAVGCWLFLPKMLS